MRTIFETLCSTYSRNSQLIEKLWTEISDRYSESHRNYHTLDHLRDIYLLLLPFKEDLEWDIMLFVLFYHDIVYAIPSTTNEKQSAELAKRQLSKLGLPPKTIDRIHTMILATQLHSSQDKITQFFLDADLAILGSSPKVYQEYLQKIRQEYSSIPEEQYKQGRIIFLKTTLAKKQIFYSPNFFHQYEQSAKVNLTNELYNYTNR